MSSTTAPEKQSTEASVVPLETLRVNGVRAAAMMGVSKTTFYERVNRGMYPRAGRDGLWSVRKLRECAEQLDEPEPTQQ